MRRFKVVIVGKLPGKIPNFWVFESLKLLRTQNWDERSKKSFIMDEKENMELRLLVMDSRKKFFLNFEIMIIKYSPAGNQKSNIFCNLQEVIFLVIFYLCSISF
jgi:hypothetical protein